MSIENKDCVRMMKDMVKSKRRVDIVLTSPPYNTGRSCFSEKSLKTHNGRYDVYSDEHDGNQYLEWICDIFRLFDRILNENGIVLWNVSYGSDGTVNKEGIGLVWLSIADIIRNTPFTVADRIVWKKSSALPNNVSKNKLTRICEDVFVFCRKEEYDTFHCNKKMKSIGKTGQQFYENIFNYIEAPNNDGTFELNKATYSTSLVTQLLDIYARQGSIVYDPFMGSGTTAVACARRGLECLGSELSPNQTKYAIERENQAKREANRKRFF